MSLVSNLDKGVELCYYERYPLNKISLYLLDEGLQLCSFFFRIVMVRLYIFS